MSKVLRFVIDVLIFALLFISLLKYLDEFDFNKPITFFVTTLIICYVMYRYELSFVEKGVPKMKNPPKPPKRSDFAPPPPPKPRTIKNSKRPDTRTSLKL